MDIKQAWLALKLAPGTSKAEVRRRFRALTSELHPDRRAHLPTANVAALDKEYQDISIAYELVLEDLDERAAVAWALEHRPELYEGTARGSMGLSVWLATVAFWRNHPSRPRQLDPKDATVMASWIRMHELVQAELNTKPRQLEPRWATPGVEMTASICLPVLVSITGGLHVVEVQLGGWGPRRFELEVPAGIDVGAEFRIPGAGGTGTPNGDLVLRVDALEVGSGRFRRHGLVVTTRRQVSYAQVYAGRIISVRTPWGTAPLQLRPGDETPHRLAGHGVRAERGGVHVVSDLVVELEVVRPAPGNAKLAAALLEAQHGEAEHRSPGDPPSDRSAR